MQRNNGDTVTPYIYSLVETLLVSFSRARARIELPVLLLMRDTVPVVGTFRRAENWLIIFLRPPRAANRYKLKDWTAAARDT